MTLKVAVPNKGSLSVPALQLLVEAGYKPRTDPKDLTVMDTANDVEFFYLRPRDIAIYVGSGKLDIGITGRDLVLDSQAPVTERLELGFAKSQFRFASPLGQSYELADLTGTKIATSYAQLVESYLHERGIKAQIVKLDGAVEISIQLGVAQVIADVVESGRSLKQNNLAPFGEIICNSEAVLVERKDSPPDKNKDQLVKRIEGVVFAQKFVMIDYDCPQRFLTQALAITPGLESPTIAPLSDPAWVAVRAMVPRKQANDVLDALAELGAKAILVSDIRTCRI